MAGGGRRSAQRTAILPVPTRWGGNEYKVSASSLIRPMEGTVMTTTTPRSTRRKTATLPAGDASRTSPPTSPREFLPTDMVRPARTAERIAAAQAVGLDYPG